MQLMYNCSRGTTWKNFKRGLRWKFCLNSKNITKTRSCICHFYQDTETSKESTRSLKKRARWPIRLQIDTSSNQQIAFLIFPALVPVEREDESSSTTPPRSIIWTLRTCRCVNAKNILWGDFLRSRFKRVSIEVPRVLQGGRRVFRTFLVSRFYERVGFRESKFQCHAAGAQVCARAEVSGSRTSRCVKCVNTYTCWENKYLVVGNASCAKLTERRRLIQR